MADGTTTLLNKALTRVDLPAFVGPAKQIIAGMLSLTRTEGTSIGKVSRPSVATLVRSAEYFPASTDMTFDKRSPSFASIFVFESFTRKSPWPACGMTHGS